MIAILTQTLLTLAAFLQPTAGILTGSQNQPVSPINNNNNNNPLFVVPCRTSLELTPGLRYRIASPGYPAPYTPWSYCSWNFYTRDPRVRVSLNCDVFELEDSTPCSNGAFLAVDTGSQNYIWFCGNNIPRNVLSTSNNLTAYFWAGWKTANRKGFYCQVRTTAASSEGSCRCGRSGGSSFRIVGGTDAEIHEFPWMALVQIPFTTTFCGGSLINEKFVLTAAHCIVPSVLVNNSLPTVILGEHQRSLLTETPYTQALQVLRVIPHEHYTQGISPKDNDIGLIELVNPVNFETTPNVAPACPPDPLNLYENIPVTVIGWGLLEYPGDGERSDLLQKAEVITVSLSVCKDQYNPGVITNNMICGYAEGKDSCFDDSGGPLMTKMDDKWILIGLVSFGPSECAVQGKSGVYTRIGNYIPWIQSKIGTTRTCPP